MKSLSLFLLLLFTAAQAKYMDNHSCNECHDTIFEEYQRSAHSWGYFNDTLHRKIADKISSTKYDCATCHMPMADNLKDIVTGKARPDKNNKTHTDAISCYFCHTIAYVKQAHRFNINVPARQAEDFKPSLYGRLENPDHNDKHMSVRSPIYTKMVCTGCHSHKRNENNVTIFHAMEAGQTSDACIKCHMPEIAGGNEQMNRRFREHHVSHRFLGIHDKEFRKKGVDINISATGTTLKVTLHNTMGHPLIIQSARAKYFKIKLLRSGRTLWENYAKDPREDRQGYFGYAFKKDGKPIVIPYHATSGSVHNLEANATRELRYTIPVIQKGDKVMVDYFVQLAKDECAKAVNLDGTDLMKPSLIKEQTYMYSGD